MLCQPFADGHHRALVCVGRGMRSVKDAYFAEQKNRDPAARAFLNFCAQFDEERLHITPLDIAARRPRKDQFDDSLVSLLYFSLVPF